MNEKILVVDDEESIRFTFEIFLSEKGYRVFTACDYGSALAKIAEEDMDLLFVDIILGGKTGIELMAAVRKKSLTTPIIIITGAPRIETAAEALRLGALDYIVKPIRQDALLRATALALKRKRLADEKERCLMNFEATFRSVQEGILTVDKEMLVVEINEAMGRICGVLRRDMIGKPFRAFRGWCSAECLAALDRTLKDQKRAEIRNLNCRAKRNPHQVVSVIGTPLLDPQGNFSGAVLVVRDSACLSDLERSLRERQDFDPIVGESEGIEKMKSLVRDLADLPTTVLITGESGTGKELVAEALHFWGLRREKPLVKVNCAALAENLMESELFGHVKGAFTGAIKDKVGRFLLADGGTILLDEIGEISLRMQLRLLRVIDTMEFERVGESTPIRVDVRILAATNINLRQKVDRGEFREDLYYRLKVMEIRVPPLRDRREDIPLLLKHFLKKISRKLKKDITGMAPAVSRLFLYHRWPGNVRELGNTLEHACIRCRDNAIMPDHLPPDFERLAEGNPLLIGPDCIREAEDIRLALQKAKWNKARAADLLGISRRTIYRKIDHFKITGAG